MVLKKGFTLIELIVVIGLLSLLILAISSTMLMSLISSNRIRTVTKVKQAGNYALSQIQTMIHNSKTIVSCDSSNSHITLGNPDGGTTEILSENDGTNPRIASNSGTYLIPSNMKTVTFSLTCEPDDESPTLVKVSFDLQSTTTENSVQNPSLHFETSASTRNE